MVLLLCSFSGVITLFAALSYGELAGMMPQGCLEVIAEAGHLPQLEQPEAVTQALQTFLAGRLPTLMLG